MKRVHNRSTRKNHYKFSLIFESMSRRRFNNRTKYTHTHTQYTHVEIFEIPSELVLEDRLAHNRVYMGEK